MLLELFGFYGWRSGSSESGPKQKWPWHISLRCSMDEEFKEDMRCYIGFGLEILAAVKLKRIPFEQIRSLIEDIDKGGPYKAYLITTVLPDTLAVFAGCMKRFYFEEDGSISAQGIRTLHTMYSQVTDNKLRPLIQMIFIEEEYSNGLETNYKAITSKYENDDDSRNKLTDILGENFVIEKFDFAPVNKITQTHR